MAVISRNKQQERPTEHSVCVKCERCGLQTGRFAMERERLATAYASQRKRPTVGVSVLHDREHWKVWEYVGLGGNQKIARAEGRKSRKREAPGPMQSMTMVG